jgi:hypothetical protein
MLSHGGDKPIEITGQQQLVFAAQGTDQTLAHLAVLAVRLREIKVAMPTGDLFDDKHANVVTYESRKINTKKEITEYMFSLH